MPNSLNISQDRFQMKIDVRYDGCKGVIGIADDMKVHSAGDGLHNHAKQWNGQEYRALSLNYEKIQMKKDSIKFS